ncbi:MAG: Trm112 family protein [Candidatus Firestonebacteria bacterium]|nr:Trm112 family protein [Candidatus Firestonebacteria bacterium]
MLDKKLLDILACPICKKELIYAPLQEKLICKNCKKVYPVQEEIPVMLEEEADLWYETVYTESKHY